MNVRTSRSDALSYHSITQKATMLERDPSLITLEMMRQNLYMRRRL